MAETDVTVGDRILDRARKLVALDRALMEIGELGVLERRPDELASLEARLFGPPAAGAANAAAGTGEDGAEENGATGTGESSSTGATSDREEITGAAEPDAAAASGAPALRLVQGAGRPSSPADQAQRRALREQFRIIEGGRKVV